MSIFSRYVLPKLIKTTCATKPLMRQREKIVPLAEGSVLEIGVGGGLNFPYYSHDKVTRIFGLDVSPELMEDASRMSKESGLEFKPLLLDAAEIPLDNGEIDTVLVTYSLCSIEEVQSALSEVRRVLKPVGKLVFCEHGAAPDPGVYRWQKRLTPVWKRFSGGCRLDRDIPGEIEKGGFRLASIEHMYLPGTMRIVGYNSWGTAIPR